jgi:tetratricopeptide (TPR) repeat protein
MIFSQARFRHVVWGCLILCCSVAQGQGLNLSDARKAFDAGKWLEAEELLRSYLAARPDSAEGHYLLAAENNLGLSYEGLFEREKAMAAYHQAIEWEKDDRQPSEQPYINLGKLLVEEDHPEEGLPYLLRAEELSPIDETIHVAMGRLYQKQGELKKAQDELEQAVQIMPSDAPAHFLLGRIYRSERLIEKANVEFSLVANLYKLQNKAQTEQP